MESRFQNHPARCSGLSDDVVDELIFTFGISFGIL